jgi:ABC-type branched-subunit amino acid transport system ATPase component
MKPEQIYQELKELAEKLNITVIEQSFKQTGIKAKSGFCIVKGRQRFIMDKNKTISEKNELLAECLAKMPHEDIFVVPAIRKLLIK